MPIIIMVTFVNAKFLLIEFVNGSKKLLLSDGSFALRKVEAGLYGVLKSEFQTHKVGIVPNF